MEWIDGIGKGIVPGVICVIVLYGYIKGVAVFDTFLEGAKDGLHMAYRITPSLVGILTAIAMFKMSGALDVLVNLFAPIAAVFQIPKEILPLAFLRPISGSGSLAVVSDIFNTYGVDSFVGKCASVIMGSTETTFYTIAIYFSSQGIKKIRHTAIAALCADFCGFVVSVFFVRLFLM